MTDIVERLNRNWVARFGIKRRIKTERFWSHFVKRVAVTVILSKTVRVISYRDVGVSFLLIPVVNYFLKFIFIGF